MISADKEQAEILLSNEYNLYVSTKPEHSMYEDALWDFITSLYDFLQASISGNDVLLITKINRFEGHFLELLISFAIFQVVALPDEGRDEQIDCLVSNFIQR
mgnify:CR=1 FL=1